MRVVVDKKVHLSIQDFYDAAMMRHISLSYETVVRKLERLYSSLDSLGRFPTLYAKARLKEDWIQAGWREYICEDFIFAYEICTSETGEDFVWVRDAVHSLLYY
jgi:hypothetical protein